MFMSRLAHNLAVLLEVEILAGDAIDNVPERKRKAKRRAKAEKSGAGYVATALQRFTVRSVKFIRWLRNFVYRETAWGDAVARLREIYATM